MGLRVLYALTSLLALSMWPYMIDPGELIDPVEGVGDAFWTAISTLAVLGIRYPLSMLPLLFLQFAYKLVWLVFVAWPLWQAGQLDPASDQLFRSMAIGVALDLVLVPWLYAARRYALPVFNWRRGDL